MIHFHTNDRSDGEKNWFNRQFFLTLGSLQWSLQIVFPSGRFSLGLEVDDYGDEIATLTWCIPPVGLYLGLEWFALGHWIRQWATKTNKSWKYNKSLSLRIHDWALWWSFWTDAHQWKSATPRWRQGSWHPFGFPDARIGKKKVLEKKIVLVRLPEGPYAAKAELYHETRQHPRWPWRSYERYVVDFDFGDKCVDTGHQKGGFRAINVGIDTPSFETGIRTLLVQIGQERERYGYRQGVS